MFGGGGNAAGKVNWLSLDIQQSKSLLLRTTRVTRLLEQQPTILAESTFKSMVPVEIEWQ